MKASSDTKLNSAPTLEELLYLLALVIALVMRLAILGQYHLTETEAGFALQAYQVSQGEDLQMLGHPAYIQLTGALFYLLGSGDVLARLLPALVGSAVILLPYLLREHLGKQAALVAAFGLALDPISIALSRQAGSPAMALGFLALAVFFWQRKQMLAAGILTGLLIMSGISFVFGLVCMLAAWAVIHFVSDIRLELQLEAHERNLLLAGIGIALAAVGTLFGLELQGLAAAVQSLADYFAGWLGGVDGQHPLAILLGLAIYQPMALLFAILLWLNRHKNGEVVNILLTILFLVFLALTLVYPARGMWMLIWAVVPLWLLAGQLIGEYLSAPDEQDRILVWGSAVFYLILLVYWRMNLTQMAAEIGLARPEGVRLLDLIAVDPASKIYLVRLLVTILIPVLIVLLSGLVSWGWAADASVRGAVWGVGAFLVFYIVMAAWGFSAPPEEVASELWVQGPSVGQTAEMVTAIEDTSMQISGTKNELALVYQIDSRLLDWLLRDFPNARYSPALSANDLPDVVLNQDLGFMETESGQLYGGQQFVLHLERLWGNPVLPPDLDNWLVYRRSPVAKDWAYLWTRADLFPLYEPAENPAPVE